MDKSVTETSVSPRDAASFGASIAAVRKGDWAAGLAAYAAAVDAGIEPDPSARVHRIIAQMRSGADPKETLPALSASLVREADARLELRRLLVSPLIHEGALNAAADVLTVIVHAWPRLADERRLLASLFGRLKRWNEAIEHADAAASIEPDEAGSRAACIQLRLQAGCVKDAARIARATLALATSNVDHVQAWITALLRDGCTALAARVASEVDMKTASNDRAAGAVVQALLADNRIDAAIGAGEGALQAGVDGPALRSQLAQAYLAGGTLNGAQAHALEHLARGAALAPRDVRLMTLHGETLLRAGRYADAIPHLQRACEVAPGLAHTRALLTRALRYAGRYDEAAQQALTLIAQKPERGRWQRLGIAALSQAGRKGEASALHERHLRARSDALPHCFADALAELDSKTDTVSIPQARLDWAWSLRRGADNTTRAEWERRARWGHLADYLLLEWLECRDDRIEEAMTLLDDLDETERRFAPLMADGRGVVVATAHVGPMYAGLMVLELLGIPSRWVATMPGVSTAHYASALISTADQPEAQVAKQCFRALQSGHAVCMAIEGAADPAAPRIPFAGQEMTYSSFAARAAHRLCLPSVFYAPRWRDGKIVQTLEMLPAVDPGEDADAYALRWQHAYLTHLRNHLAGPPEDLRLSGGVWRHVRPLDRSGEPHVAV